MDRWKGVLDEAKEYILGLTDYNGALMVHHSRKRTGFIGFLVDISSVSSIIQHNFLSGNLNCLLPYKLSQDHLELLFSAVRAKGGFSNNATVLQF